MANASVHYVAVAVHTLVLKQMHQARQLLMDYKLYRFGRVKNVMLLQSSHESLSSQNYYCNAEHSGLDVKCCDSMQFGKFWWV